MDIVTIISSVGFPIAACIGMGWYVKYQGDQHKDETKALTDALNNNTLAITKLVEKLEDN